MSQIVSDLPRLLIAYARVSTDQQSSDLDGQIRDLNVEADQRGYPFLEIHEDVGSAHKPTAVNDLPGLKAALKRAVELGSGLVIRDPSRLSRNLKEFRERIAPTSVPIHSLEHGRILSVAELEGEILKAERDAESIGSGTKLALGMKRKSRPDSAEMRRRAQIDVQNRQLQVMEDIIVGKRILRDNPAITARQFGEELIRNGRRPPRGDHFTLLTARERLRATKAEIELEDEEDDFPGEIGAGGASGMAAGDEPLSAADDPAAACDDARSACQSGCLGLEDRKRAQQAFGDRSPVPTQGWQATVHGPRIGQCEPEPQERPPPGRT
ncbi:recombinase family protein [Stagnihabitans tardus]|uniref:Recombinase family protein n=1 Tax=Stagnihabitans tardus TaxID=2699202 RepID=A0AAE4Y986_9RHOB|nr:recombinase family protein [Stagnihabitans tardus]NBZ87579.1 recombinase family protein [Stagnihabitans tardus]